MRSNVRSFNQTLFDFQDIPTYFGVVINGKNDIVLKRRSTQLPRPPFAEGFFFRHHGATTLRLGRGEGGGGMDTVNDLVLGGTRHIFLLVLYNSKNIGGGEGGTPPPVQRSPQSLFFSFK